MGIAIAVAVALIIGFVAGALYSRHHYESYVEKHEQRWLNNAAGMGQLFAEIAEARDEASTNAQKAQLWQERAEKQAAFARQLVAVNMAVPRYYTPVHWSAN